MKNTLKIMRIALITLLTLALTVSFMSTPIFAEGEIDNDLYEEFYDDYDDDDFIYDDDFMNRSVFWVGFVLFCIMTPIPIIIVGCVLGRKQKHQKYWYSIAFSAGAWMFISIVIAAIIATI